MQHEGHRSASPCRVRSHSFAPYREALHTPVSREAPMNPLCPATRAQKSTRAMTREKAESARVRRVVGAIVGVKSFAVCLLKVSGSGGGRCFFLMAIFAKNNNNHLQPRHTFTRGPRASLTTSPVRTPEGERRLYVRIGEHHLLLVPAYHHPRARQSRVLLRY
jgi:hypothetical protein